MLHPVYLLTHVFPLLAIGAVLIRAFGKMWVADVVFAPVRLLRFLLIIALLGFSGCSNTHELATAKGPWFQLNPDQWQAKPNDLNPPKAAQ